MSYVLFQDLNFYHLTFLSLVCLLVGSSKHLQFLCVPFCRHFPSYKCFATSFSRNVSILFYFKGLDSSLRSQSASLSCDESFFNCLPERPLAIVFWENQQQFKESRRDFNNWLSPMIKWIFPEFPCLSYVH
jgi:hypothetical protein